MQVHDDELPIKFCPSCDKAEGFKDQPLTYNVLHWPDATHSHDVQRTKCKACGATYPVTSIDESVREGAD